VPCNTISVDEFASTTPVRPPTLNRNTNPSAHKQAALYVMRVLYIVSIHLKILIPVGTATVIVADLKYALVSTSVPTVNVWCAHTTKPSNPFVIIAKIIPRFQNVSFFSLSWQMMWEIIPNYVRGYTKLCERLYQIMWEVIPNYVRDYTKLCERLYQIMWEIIPNYVRGYTKLCERLYQIMWEVIPNYVRDYTKLCERLYQIMWETITNYVRDYTKWCERLYQIMWDIIPNDVRDYIKLCERLYQILVGWEYKLQDVRRIKINVDKELDLPLLPGAGTSDFTNFSLTFKRRNVTCFI
jgi:hypothetical protein